jgi:prepilin peptidase CpaA
MATDIASRRILNAFTYPAILSGLLLNLMVGWAPLASAAGACLLSVFIYYPICRAGGMGLGDLKLMAAIGALMGLDFWFKAQVASALVGGVAALALAAYHGTLMRALQGALTVMGGIFGAIFMRKPLRMPRSALGQAIPYGVAIAIGTIGIWIRYRWPW